MAKGFGKTVETLGDYVREQRMANRLSLRQLADAAGVSNPYLSQIERGLRKPSAEILQQIARALRISAETLYVKAGILDDRSEAPDVASAIMRDGSITERQKQILLQVYQSFRDETERRRKRRRKPRPAVEPVRVAEAGGRVESAG